MENEVKGGLYRNEFWDHRMPFIFPKEEYTALI